MSIISKGRTYTYFWKFWYSTANMKTRKTYPSIFSLLLLHSSSKAQNDIRGCPSTFILATALWGWWGEEIWSGPGSHTRKRHDEPLHIPYSTTIRPPQTALILRSIKLTIVFFNKRTLHSNSYVKITADEIYVFCVTDKMKLADWKMKTLWDHDCDETIQKM